MTGVEYQEELSIWISKQEELNLLLKVNISETMINKKVLKDITSNHSVEKVENYLIRKYIISNSLNAKKSSILNPFFNDDFTIEIEFKDLNIESLKDLENYLELLIPKSDRKLNGAFFTPNFIVDFIIHELNPKESDKCLDPACGTGVFLIGLAEYYLKRYGKSIKRTVQENIFGSDILEYNIERAKILLSILALENGEYLDEDDFNLINQDSLRGDWNRKFDVIVGNPPYVKYQDLSDVNRAYLLKEWTTIQRGTFNLYFAFFELGYQLLDTNGRLGYITPNNYFTSLAGRNLRAFFARNKCVNRIVDFSHKKVFDAQTYTAITFLNKKKNDSILYDRIKKEDTPIQFTTKANGSPNNLRDLNVKKWRLLKTKEQKNIKIIENIGTPIKELFDICVGIATLKDDVFFVDKSESCGNFFIKATEKGTFKIEKEATKSVYKISNFKSQKEIINNTRRIIFPYIIKSGSAVAIPEPEFKLKYPECYKYLLTQREILDSRDKGKVTFSPFYVWGRTQGLTKRGKKILNPTFSRYPRFLLVEEEDAFFTNGYGIYFKRGKDKPVDLFSNLINPLALEENIDLVQKILNSYVMHYYVSKTSVSIAGGYPCYQKNFIEKFTIPTFTEKEMETLKNLSNKKNIDEFLILKYQLNFPAPNLVE